MCLGCGKVFQPTSGNQTCCSRACWLAQSNIKKNPEKFRARNCPNCGKPVENNPHRSGIRIFCSKKCNRAHYHKETCQSKMADKKACPQCGKMFVRNSSRQIYCSSRCWHDQNNIRKHPEKYSEKYCLTCGVLIVNAPRNHGRRLFCSDQCGRKYHDRKQREKNRNPFVEKACLQCGKTFLTKYPFQVCCSKRCRSRRWNERRAPGKHDDRVCPRCGKIFRQSYDTRGRQRYCRGECQKASKLERDSETLSRTQFERKKCVTAFAPDRWRRQLAVLAAEQQDTEKPRRRIILVLGRIRSHGLYRLCEIVRYQLGADPCSGDLYVFCNAARSVLRYFEWDGAEFCVGYRRAHRGTFPWPWEKDCAAMEITKTEWEFLLHKSARTLMRTNLKSP